MSREEYAFRFLCRRLQRDYETSEESDTISLRAAYRAMIDFADREMERLGHKPPVVRRQPVPGVYGPDHHDAGFVAKEVG